MDMMAAGLFAIAGAVGIVMGVIGLAHIQRAWLRWACMVGYVVCVVAVTFGVPIALRSIT
jgi:hypothetical protein